MKKSRRKFIKNSTGMAAGLFAPNIVTKAARHSGKSVNEKEIPINFGNTLTGVAEVDISPEIGMERPGNYRKIYHESFHDPCKVRVAVFDDGSKRVAIVGIDALMIHRSLVKSVRKRIKKQCGIEL